jgi:uncharacterized membrane protein YkvA (DUF1232 family)
MTRVLVGVAASLLAVYLTALAGLWIYARRHPEAVSARDALRLLPDVLRLIKGLATDEKMPRRLRFYLLLLLAYLASPIDLVPDFIPLLGYADDAIIIALALRAVVRTAGGDALSAHWPGSQAGLAFIRRLAGIEPRPADSS